MKMFLHLMDDSYSPRNVINYSDDLIKYFSSNDSPNSWILFEFTESYVSLSNYTIKSDFTKSKQSDSPKSWVIEGSNDNETWIIIDEQKNVVLTNTKRFIHTFSIENPKDFAFNFIRMRLTDKNWSGNNFFKVGSIEFFGKLYSKS